MHWLDVLVVQKYEKKEDQALIVFVVSFLLYHCCASVPEIELENGDNVEIVVMLVVEVMICGFDIDGDIDFCMDYDEVCDYDFHCYCDSDGVVVSASWNL